MEAFGGIEAPSDEAYWDLPQRHRGLLCVSSQVRAARGAVEAQVHPCWTRSWSVSCWRESDPINSTGQNESNELKFTHTHTHGSSKVISTPRGHSLLFHHKHSATRKQDLQAVSTSSESAASFMRGQRTPFCPLTAHREPSQYRPSSALEGQRISAS
eukprot:2585099-Amphidinium_carterae.1